MKTLQIALLNEVKQRIDSKLRLVDVVGDILEVSSDASYRRIRGDKELSLSEAQKLSQHFNISLDAIANNKTDTIPFKYTFLDFSDVSIYENYVKSLVSMYEGLLTFDKKEVVLTAQDIPVFHFMPYTELTFFKVYVISQNSSNSMVSYNEFVKQLNREKLEGYYKQLGDTYKMIPSSEVWSVHTVEPLINLLEYYIDINAFDDEKTPRLLCQQFLNMIDDVERLAENSVMEHKGRKTPFNFYLSPIDMHNDFILTKNENSAITSVKLYTINAVFTSDPMFTAETQKWIDQVLNKSLLLSGASERERIRFFKKIKTKVKRLIESIDE